MKILVVGLGKVGTSIINDLVIEGHDIIGIDIESSIVEKIVDNYDVRGVCGNGTSYDILCEADVKGADLIISTTKNDETNILSCLVAKTLGVKNTVARVRDPEYITQFESIHNKINIDYIINPEQECAKEIVRKLRFPFATNVESFTNDKVECLEFVIPHKNFLSNKKVKNVLTKNDSHIIFCTVVRDNEVMIPNGDFKLQEGDKISIVGTSNAISDFFKKIDMVSQKVKNVMVVGGSNISYYLARILYSQKQNIKIIERDMEKCTFVKNLLPHIEVVCADGTEKNVLEEEGLAKSDAFVALTGIDEANILISIYARKHNVENVIAKVNKETFVDILDELKLNTYVSTKTISASKIVQYVRALEVPGDSSIKSLYKIANGRAVAFEFDITNNPLFVGKSLKEMEFDKDLVVASIISGRECVIPNGETIFRENDIVVFVSKNMQIKKLEDVLKR